MLLDNLFAHPQTKPSAECTFSHEERLEDMTPRTRTDAFAVISYRDPDAAITIPDN
jgi:hypothetical protein